MTSTDLDRLCSELESEFANDPRGRRVVQILERYSRDCEDWRAFATYSQETYTRNLVFRCGQYELLLLCWGEGQVSPIHNHMGQSCWMAVLEGHLQEVQYQARPSTNGAGESSAQASLELGKVRDYQAGQVAYIEDSIGLHLVRPATGSVGVSLHLYAGAIDECRIYDEHSGEATLTALGYHSVRGTTCSDRSPEAIRAEWSTP